MPTMDDIRQGGTPFDPFLYALVGEDRNGNEVTVLSALARLGLEPWDAAAELAGLTRAAAHTRLVGLLARFQDVPGLGRDHAATAQRLIDLLPRSAGRLPNRGVEKWPAGGLMGFGPILAFAVLIIYGIKTVFFG
jgi:hypothetical protein